MLLIIVTILLKLDHPYEPICPIFRRNRFEIINTLTIVLKIKIMTSTETGYKKLPFCLKHTDKIVSLKVVKSTIPLMNKEYHSREKK